MGFPIDETVEGLLSERHLPVVAYCCRGNERWSCISVSASIEVKFGIQARSWIADPHVWLEHVHPDDRERLITDRLAAVSERRKLATQYRLSRNDGVYRWVFDEAEPEIRDGHDPLMHGVLTDITNRRHSDAILSELYEAARRQASRLQVQVEDRDLFMRLLAHDLRTPLAAASSALLAVQERIDRPEPEGTSERHADLLQRAAGAIEQARELVTSVLELDRWSGERSLQVAPVLLSEVAKLGVATSEFADREVIVDVPDGEAMLDLLVVSRALANLVNNAVEHTPPGGCTRVRAYQQMHPPSVIFSVEDEGPGIPESLRGDIFRPFVSSRTEHGDARGLGLTLVQRMASLHGGRVWFEELPTGGLAFHLLVPQP